MEENKKKRGRAKGEPLVRPDQKKLPTFSDKYEEDLIKKLFEAELKKKSEDEGESPYYEEDPNKVHQKREGLWDVLVDEEIHYFDPELSYELTGYRPINMTQGLDFNPTFFREAAISYETTGSYTEFLPDSKPYNDYWQEQYKRCVEGYSVGIYRITGDHYFFLNFYRMPVVQNDTKKAIAGQEEGFPNFLSKQYEFFHYLEMCEYTGKDCIMLKARGLDSWPPITKERIGN